MTLRRLVMFVLMCYLATGPMLTPSIVRLIDLGYFFRHKEDDSDRCGEHYQDQFSIPIGEDGDD